MIAAHGLAACTMGARSGDRWSVRTAAAITVAIRRPDGAPPRYRINSENPCNSRSMSAA
jgi:hypothetical protein